MVVPNRHVPNLASLTPNEQAELMRFTRRAEIVLNEAYAPHGLNVGINLGSIRDPAVVRTLKQYDPARVRALIDTTKPMLAPVKW